MTAAARVLTCRELTDFLGDYVDGTLGLDERALFDGHVAECPDCLAYLRTYAETLRLAKDAHADDPVLDVVPERLVQAILSARRHGRPRRGR